MSTLLVIDDSPIALAIARAALEDAGYSVTTASSWHEAASLLIRDPDLVLLDVDMPDLPGPHLCRLIKSAHPERKVVLHSSRPQDELYEVAKECGADGAISKSSNPAILPGLVAPFLVRLPGEHREQQTAQHPEPSWTDESASATRQRPRPKSLSEPVIHTPKSIPGAAPRALIIDDDPAFLDQVSAALRSSGVEVQVTSEWWSVSRMVRLFMPDLVLLDVRMPGLKGDVICRSLRPIYPDVNIVIFSHLSRLELERLGAECGADGVIPKTDDARAFVSQVQRYLRSGLSGEERPA